MGKRLPPPEPKCPTYDSPLLQTWAAGLPSDLWEICDFRRDMTPTGALIAVEHTRGLARPEKEHNQLFDAQEALERLIEAGLSSPKKKERIAQHQSKSWNHGTPAPVVDAARITLGGVDLDPASSVEFNRVVRAANYFTESADGLTQPWRGRVFLNPPGGSFVLKESESEGMSTAQIAAVKAKLADETARWETKSRACAWWRKLVEEFDAGRVRSAIFVGFTLEILRSAQGGKWAHPFDFALCVPKDRLEFEGKDPTHANVIVYLGAHDRRFRAQFEQFGRVEL